MMRMIGNNTADVLGQRQYRFSAKSSAWVLSLACSTIFTGLPAMAMDANTLPQNGQVVGGDASFDYSTPSELHIHQSSDRVVIDWDSFNIGADALTQFHQTGSHALAVNRVTGAGADPTQILGTLKANGNVMVLDRNGVLFGQNSRVDVGGLIVSTGDIDVDSVMNGGSALEITGADTDGQIVLDGQINIAEAGLAAFVAPQVIHNGIINAKAGRVQIGAANTATLDLYGDSLMELAVDEELENALIENNGQIIAESGTVHITAVAAKDVVDNIINMDGVITTASATQKGGKIVLEGANTHVSGELNADGATGGGEIYIGGGLKGQGPIRHAGKVTVTDTAKVTANATDVGNGGEIIVWSDTRTEVAGVFEAKGGENGGDGGFIETSTAGNLHVAEDTVIDVSAAHGDGGEWLLDPEDILISDGGGDVSTATINATLNGGGDVTITTAAGPAGSGNITFSSANVDKSVSNNEATLTLQAINDIVMNNSSIDSSSGDELNVVLNSDFDGDQAGQITITNTSIDTNGGYFVAGGGSAGAVDTDGNGILGDGGIGADVTAAYGNATRNDGVYLGNFDLNTGAGDIVITGKGYDAVDEVYAVGVYMGDGSGTSLQTTSGDIKVTGTGGDGDSFNHGIWARHSGTTFSTDTGAITITGTGGTDVNADGSYNFGVYLESGATVSSTGVGAGAVNITGTAADAEDYSMGVSFYGDGTQVSSLEGNITITGQAGSNGADTSGANYGVDIDGADILSTGTGVNAATITIDGTAGDGGNSNHGVNIEDANTTISSVDGDISITGVGGHNGSGNGDGNRGVYIIGGADILSTGTGADAATITIDGTGADADDDNYGVRVNGTGTLISSVEGDISITGQGGSNGAAGSNNNHGVFVDGAAIIESTGTAATAATITFDGTGGDGEDYNSGVRIEDASTEVRSVAGNISITGQAGSHGGALSSNNYGVYLGNEAKILSTGTTADAATITLDGTGGAGEDSNYGVYINSANTLLSSVNGNISITGQGGTNSGADSDNNSGVYVTSGSTVSSTGAGADAATITIDGTGASADDNNYGVYVNSSATRILSQDGDINITGQGGSSGSADSNSNLGINVINAQINSTNNANVTVTGTAGAGDDGNKGINIAGDGALISNVNGDILLNGTGNQNGALTNTAFNYGTDVDFGADLNITGTGNLTVQGQGGESNDAAIRFLNGGNSGNITVNSGDITVIGDNVGFGVDQFSSTSGDIYIKPLTNSATIGIGGGSGTLSISDASLDLFSAGGKLVIGLNGTGTGAVDINSWDLSGTSYDVEVYGGTVDLGGVTMGGGSLLVHAQNDAYSALTLSGAITRSVAGNATVDLRAEGGIFLTAGDDITATNGSLNIILNSNRDNDIQGLISVVDVTLDSNGGDIILGGGADPLNTSTQDFRGVTLTNATLTADAGNISVRGRSKAGSGTYWQGAIISGSQIETTTGNITLAGESQTTGDNSPGIKFQNSTVQTDSGTVSITGNAQQNNTNNYGVWLVNSDVVINGAGDLDVTGISQIDDVYADVNSAFGSVTANGNFEFNVDDIRLDGGAIETDGNLTIKPRTAGTTIGLGGGVGDLNLTDTELALLDVGGTLVIGDSAAGTGDVDIDSWDLSSKTHDTEIYGGDIDIGGITMGGGDILMHARDGGDVADITVSDTISRSVDGDATLTLRADQNISLDAAIMAVDANSDGDGDVTTSPDRLHVILNSDRDNDEAGAIYQNSAAAYIRTHGGDVTMGGGLDPTSDYAVASEDGVFDNGLYLNGNITAGGGNISLYGKGEDIGANNDGIRIRRNITTTGTGTITMNGIGGAGTGNGNNGIRQTDFEGNVVAENGEINITALGGGSGGSLYNHGYALSGQSDITTTDGNINIHATEGLSGEGFARQNSLSVIESVDGDITVDVFGGAAGINIQTTGTGASAGNIILRTPDHLHSPNASTVDGDITIETISTTMRSFIRSTGDGNITIDSDNYFQFANATTSDVSTASGNIIITTDSYSVHGSAVAPVSAGGDLTINPFTNDRTIGIGGGAGSLNFTDAELATFTVGGKLTIGDSANGTGDVDIDSWDISGTTYDVEIYGGDIDIGGITMGAGDILMHARDGADAADITISAAITRNDASDAVLDLRADQNIVANAGGDITESGAGALDIIINADRDADQDGSIKFDGVTLTSNGGDITLGGGADAATTAAWGSSSVDDDGVDLNNTDLIAGAGDIRLTGHGDDDAGTAFNMGIVMSSGSSAQTTTGDIILNGTGGVGGNDNSGINMTDASLIQSNGGEISLTGIGQGTGIENYGVYVQNGSDIIASGSATITIDGTGTASGSGSNHGVFLEGSGTTLTNTDGAIDVDGAATSGAGIYVNNGAILENTGASAADITIDGTSSGGSGVNVSNANAGILTNGANMIINATSTGSSNGLRMRGTGSTSNQPSIRTSGAGNLTINASSASGTGLDMNEFARIRADGTGDFNLTVSGNRAIYTRRAEIRANDGDLNITATASGSQSWYTDKQTTLQTIDGDLTFTGNREIRFINGATLRSVNGDTTITTSDIQVTGGTPFIGAGGTLIVKPYDVNSTIGLGGGAGTFNLSDAELLNNFNAATLIIGDSTNGAGAVDINPVDLSAEGFDLEVYGGSINADGLDAGNSLLLVANGGGNITLDGAISATGAGNSVVLVGDSFTNNAGAAAINPGAGRFLVYADQFSDLSDGGMTAGNYYGATYAGNAPATITAGNRFVYQEQPTLTITADDVSQAPGAGAPTFTYSVSGLRGSDTLAEALSGAPSFVKGAIIGQNKFAINASAGSASSPIGYVFDFVSGVLDANVSLANTTIDHQVQTLTEPAPQSVNLGADTTTPDLGGLVKFLDEDEPTQQNDDLNTITPESGGNAPRVKTKKTEKQNSASSCLVTNGVTGGCISGKS